MLFSSLVTSVCYVFMRFSTDLSNFQRTRCNIVREPLVDDSFRMSEHGCLVLDGQGKVTL